MIIAIYGIVLIVFWILTLRINPEHYPNTKPEDVQNWQAGKLYDYRRYAGFLLIWIILAFVNGAFGSYLYKHPSHTLNIVYYALVSLTAAIMIVTLVYIALRAYKRNQWAKQVGIKK